MRKSPAAITLCVSIGNDFGGKIAKQTGAGKTHRCNDLNDIP